MSDTPAKTSANATVVLMQAKTDALKALVGENEIARFMANVMATLRKDTKLLRCDPGSFYAAAHQAATLKLQPGILGQVFLVPYGQTATLIVGYKGMMEMARRHSDVVKITASCVYEGEMYERDGATGDIIHKTNMGVDKSDDKLLGAYCRVVIRGSKEPISFELNRDQIEKRRGKAKASQFWRDHYAAMCRKTVVRAAFNGGELPVSADLERGLQYEQEQERQTEILEVRSETPDVPPTEMEVGFDIEESPGTSTPPTTEKSSRRQSEPANLTDVDAFGLGDAEAP